MNFSYNVEEQARQLSPRQLRYVSIFLSRRRPQIEELQHAVATNATGGRPPTSRLHRALLRRSYGDAVHALHGGSFLSGAATGVKTAYTGVARAGERLDNFVDGAKHLIATAGAAGARKVMAAIAQQFKKKGALEVPTDPNAKGHWIVEGLKKTAEKIKPIKAKVDEAKATKTQLLNVARTTVRGQSAPEAVVSAMRTSLDITSLATTAIKYLSQVKTAATLGGKSLRALASACKVVGRLCSPIGWAVYVADIALTAMRRASGEIDDVQMFGAILGYAPLLDLFGYENARDKGEREKQEAIRRQDESEEFAITTLINRWDKASADLVLRIADITDEVMAFFTDFGGDDPECRAALNPLATKLEEYLMAKVELVINISPTWFPTRLHPVDNNSMDRPPWLLRIQKENAGFGNFLSAQLQPTALKLIAYPPVKDHKYYTTDKPADGFWCPYDTDRIRFPDEPPRDDPKLQARLKAEFDSIINNDMATDASKQSAIDRKASEVQAKVSFNRTRSAGQYDKLAVTDVSGVQTSGGLGPQRGSFVSEFCTALILGNRHAVRTMHNDGSAVYNGLNRSFNSDVNQHQPDGYKFGAGNWPPGIYKESPPGPTPTISNPNQDFLYGDLDFKQVYNGTIEAERYYIMCGLGFDTDIPGVAVFAQSDPDAVVVDPTMDVKVTNGTLWLRKVFTDDEVSQVVQILERHWDAGKMKNVTYPENSKYKGGIPAFFLYSDEAKKYLWPAMQNSIRQGPGLQEELDRQAEGIDPDSEQAAFAFDSNGQINIAAMRARDKKAEAQTAVDSKDQAVVAQTQNADASSDPIVSIQKTADSKLDQLGDEEADVALYDVGTEAGLFTLKPGADADLIADSVNNPIDFFKEISDLGSQPGLTKGQSRIETLVERKQRLADEKAAAEKATRLANELETERLKKQEDARLAFYGPQVGPVKEEDYQARLRAEQQATQPYWTPPDILPQGTLIDPSAPPPTFENRDDDIAANLAADQQRLQAQADLESFYKENPLPPEAEDRERNEWEASHGLPGQETWDEHQASISGGAKPTAEEVAGKVHNIHKLVVETEDHFPALRVEEQLAETCGIHAMNNALQYPQRPGPVTVPKMVEFFEQRYRAFVRRAQAINVRRSYSGEAFMRIMPREEYLLKHSVSDEEGFNGLQVNTLITYLEQILLVSVQEFTEQPSLAELTHGSWILYGAYHVDLPGHPQHGTQDGGEEEFHFIAIYNDIVMDSNVRLFPPYRLSRRFAQNHAKMWPHSEPGKTSKQLPLTYVPTYFIRLNLPGSQVDSDTETVEISLDGSGKKHDSGYTIQHHKHNTDRKTSAGRTYWFMRRMLAENKLSRKRQRLEGNGVYVTEQNERVSHSARKNFTLQDNIPFFISPFGHEQVFGNVTKKYVTDGSLRLFKWSDPKNTKEYAKDWDDFWEMWRRYDELWPETADYIWEALKDSAKEDPKLGWDVPIWASSAGNDREFARAIKPMFMSQEPPFVGWSRVLANGYTEYMLFDPRSSLVDKKWRGL